MTRDELISRRDTLIKSSGMSWKELESLGKCFQLDDNKYNVYRTIRAINWVLDGK